MLDFPTSPTTGQKYPTPSVAGLPTYTWDGEKWTTVAGAMGNDFVKKTGDVMTGLLQLSGDPTAPLHAVTKQYVDVRPTTDPSKVAKAGDTMSGPLTINSTLTTTGAGTIGGNLVVSGNAMFLGGSPQLINSGGDYNHYYDRAGNAGVIIGSGPDASNYLRNTTTFIQSIGGGATYGTFNSVGLTTLNIRASGDIYTYRNATSGFVFLGSNGGHYVGFDGARYIMYGAPLGVGDPQAGGDAATVNWVNATLGSYIYNVRLVFVADTNTASASVIEPYGGAVITGGSGSLYNYVMYRFRYLQVATTSWWTVGYA